MKIIILTILLSLLVWSLMLLYCKETKKEIQVEFPLWINIYFSLFMDGEYTKISIFGIK